MRLVTSAQVIGRDSLSVAAPATRPERRGTEDRGMRAAATAALLFALLSLPPAPLVAQGTAPAGDGEADANHYRVDARIEPSTGRVDVELDMRWLPAEGTDTLSFFLHRDLGRPAVEGDAVAGVEVEPYGRFAQAFNSDTSYTNRVSVALSETATPDEPVVLRWSYGGTLATDRIRLGGSAVTPHWVELQIGSLWVPVGASLREQFTFDAEVELPEGFEVVSSGPVERDGTIHRIRSTVLNPDVPVIASDRFQNLRREGEGPSPSVSVYHTGAADSVITFMADHAEQLLARYDERFHTGRELESLRITIPPVRRAQNEAYARPGLIAMSHGSGNRADLGTYRLLAHEAAHLWWTDAADTQSRHNFLNESFAEYEAFLSLRAAYGEEAFEKQIEQARKQAADAPGLDEWSPQLNDVLVRGKGPWLLHRLHERIGEDAYVRFLRALQREDVGTLQEMVRALGETTDEETARWFEEQLFP